MADGLKMLSELVEAQTALIRATSLTAQASARIEDKLEEIMTRLASLEALVIETASGR